MIGGSTIKAHIYKITFPDGTVYVGSTTQPVKKRISGHITALRTGKRAVKSLLTPFKKFGWHKDGSQTFTGAIITSEQVEISTRRHLRQHEQHAMGKIPPDKLLNIRHATGDHHGYLHNPHNFMIKPVDCRAMERLILAQNPSEKRTAA